MDASPFRVVGAADRGLLVLDAVGVVATLVGLWLLSGTLLAGFDFGRALGGIGSTLPETFGAAISVFLGTAMNLAAGAVVVRLLRPEPYASLAHLAVSGLAGAVLLDVVLLL